MKLCNEGHLEIVFTTNECPLCELIEKNEIQSQALFESNEKISDLIERAKDIEDLNILNSQGEE